MAEQPKAPAVTAATPFILRPAKRNTRYLKMLVYGDFGVGKTTLAVSAQDVPGMGDVVMADVESGDMSVSDREDITVAPISDFGQFARLYDYLRIHCKYRDENNIDALRQLEAKFSGVALTDITKPKVFRTLVVDSLTEVQKYAMYKLLGVNIGTVKLDEDIESPKYAEWGKSAEMIRLLVRTLRDLPMNVIFVCSQQTVEDERKRQLKKPALPGKLANEVQGFLDVVGYYVAAPMNDSGDMARRLWLTPGQTYQAKNRFPNWHGSFIDNPTMATIMSLNK